MLQGALGEFAISELSGEGAPITAATPTTLRFATHTMVTASNDTPANTAVEGRLTGSFLLRREIAGGSAGRFGGLIATTITSELEIANADRELDELLTGYVDGRAVRLKIGTTSLSGGSTVMPRYDALQLAHTAIAGTFGADQDTLRLRLRDQGLELQGEIQTRTYAGTGGREGGAALAGRSKPLLLGRAANIQAQLIDEAYLVYQVTTGAVSSIAPYDSGVAIPIASNHATYGGMLAANCPPGQAVTCLNEGVFRLQIVASGAVTADVLTAVDSTAGLIDLILQEAGVPAARRSITTIADADDDEPGYFQPAGSNASIESVIAALAEAAGASFGTDRSGVYRLVWLDRDALAGAADFSFGWNDLVDLERLPLPYGVPWRGWVIGSERNWTVQSPSELAGNVSEARRQYLEREYRAVRTADPEVAVNHQTSRETDLVPTFYYTGAPAVRFGNRMAAWYSSGRGLYRAIVKTALCQIEVGDIVEITAPRWGLDAGLKCMAVGVTDDLGAVTTELLLFG